MTSQCLNYPCTKHSYTKQSFVLKKHGGDKIREDLSHVHKILALVLAPENSRWRKIRKKLFRYIDRAEDRES